MASPINQSYPSTSSASIPVPTCTGCSKTDEKVSLCTRCKIASYCGKECQTRDWPTHRKVCKQSDNEGKHTVAKPLPLYSRSKVTVMREGEDLSTGKTFAKSYEDFLPGDILRFDDIQSPQEKKIGRFLPSTKIDETTEKTEPKKTPLSLKQIYKIISQYICRVNSKGTCTGFFLHDTRYLDPNYNIPTILVPTHNLSWKFTNEADKTMPVLFDNIEVIYEKNAFTAEYCGHPLTFKQLESSHHCLFRYLKSEQPLNLPRIEGIGGLGFDIQLEPGEEVFFGGFPLTQLEPTFHKGTISSVNETGEYFTIDGTIVPGNSGSPVYLQHEGNLKLIGVVFAEVADMDPEYHRLKKSLEEMRGKWEGERHKILLEDKEGNNKEEYLHPMEALETALRLIERNMSTGIGKCVHIKHFMELILGLELPERPEASYAEHLVAKERFSGHLATDLEYREWWHRSVKGQPLCGTILGRLLTASDQISVAEEKTLWTYYEKNSLKLHQHQNKKTVRPDIEKLDRLTEKILASTNKSLKTNATDWRAQLNELATALPDEKSKIQKLLLSFPAKETVSGDSLTLLEQEISAADGPTIEANRVKWREQLESMKKTIPEKIEEIEMLQKQISE